MKRSFAPRTSGLRSKVAAVAAVALSALVLSGCAAPQDTPSEPDSFGELSIQLSWVKTVEFAGEFIADDRGYFTDAGFDSVNLIAGPAPTASIVASGQAFAGISDPTRVAPAIANEGAPVKIVGTLYQRSPFTIISLADGADIATPEDLVGKRIGIQTGNEPLFYALLDANDISHDDVTIVPVEYDPTPLVTGDIDGYLGYSTDEFVTIESQGYDVTSLLFADNGLELTAESLVVSQDSIDNDREAVKALLYALIQGWNDAIAEPEEGVRLATEVYGKDLGIDPELAAKQAAAGNELTQSADTDANGLFTMTQDLIDSNIAILKAIDVPIEADQLFDMSLLDEVYQEHPELLE